MEEYERLLTSEEFDSSLQNDEVVMRNGDVLIVSKKRAQDLRRTLNRYWGEILV